MGLLFGYRSHVGQVRDLNEDSYLAMAAPSITPEIDALLVVADGVGGHQAGEIASGYVVDTFSQLFSSQAYQARVAHDSQRQDYFAAVLKEILEQVNAHLQEMGVARRGLSGMGTTATVALVTGKRLFVGHVGDTRAYLLRRGQLHRLTADHSWVQEQVQAGVLSPRDAVAHPRRNVLTRSLGNQPVVRVDRSTRELENEDVLLLCSDGLTIKVSDSEITKALQGNRDPQKVCGFLVDLANQRGGQDNITVLVARLSDQIRGNNLAGGIAIGPRATRVREEAATTQKIARPRFGTEARGATKSIVTGLVFAVVVLAFSALSAIANMLVVQRSGRELLWAVGLFAGLWTLAGILIGMLGAALIPRD